MAQVGVEPTASGGSKPGWSASCLPEPSSPGWTRTTDRLLVRELPSPLGYRTIFSTAREPSQGTSPRTRTLTNWVGTSRAANYTRDAHLQRKPWDSNPQGTSSRTCFRGRLLIRPDDFRCLASSGDRNRTNGLLVQSQASLPAATTPDRRSLGTRSGPSKFGEKDLKVTRYARDFILPFVGHAKCGGSSPKEAA